MIRNKKDGGIFMESRTGGIINTLDFKKPGVKIVYWIFFAIMILVALVCFVPPLWLILSSLKDIKEFYAIPPTLIPKTFDIGKIKQVWVDYGFLRYYINTFGVTVGTLFFSLVFNAALGYFLSKLKPKGSAVIFSLMLWSMMLPNTVGMVPVFKNIIDFPVLHVNFTNTFWPMWMMAGASAFNVIIFKGFFDGIPQSLVEAARIDGASNFGIFYKIILPLSRPVLMTIAIFTVNGTWADWFWPYMVLKDKSVQTIMVAIFNMRSASMDIQFVGLSLAIVPPVLLFLFFQKYIMQGFTLSGIKG